MDGEFLSAQRYDGGHINETYVASYRLNGSVRRFVHQRINTAVFTDARALSGNIARVTGHLREKLYARNVPGVERRVLRVVPTRAGEEMLITDGGEHWRTYEFIEETVTRLNVETSSQAYAAAHAFGEFADLLADLSPQLLAETISGFHDTGARLERLHDAVRRDSQGRVRECRADIERAHENAALAKALPRIAADEHLALRAVHNDAKISNVLFDAAEGHAICVIDLDTVMPGLLLYDAGELVRTACTRAAEDEPQPENVTVEPDFLDAVLAGFASGARTARAERRAFVTAGRVLAYENGVRFLTDHLDGDRYFRVHRPGHNLQRARVQFALVCALEVYEEL